jgi:NHL repeat
MTRFRSIVVAVTMLATGPFLPAQVAAPEIPFETKTDLLKWPDNIYLGEAAGVATNSKGHIFVYTRTGAAHATVGTSRTFYKAGSRLFEFDQAGKFVREIGQGVYGFNFAQAVRVDPQDNIWVVDEGSTQVIKFDPDGRIQMVFSRKPEAIAVRPAAPLQAGAAAAGGRGAGGGGRGAAGGAGAGIPGDNFTRTADVAWDRAGNIYVADGLGDGIGNARVAKFDKDGHFLKSWGSRGSEPGQFNALHGIAVDTQGNVYVADAGNKRIQVFDSDGKATRQISNIGTPWAICMTTGPHQFLYSSNSNDPETLDHGEIYKLELDGRVVGQFGRAGKLPKEFGTVNTIDCRTENEIFVGELLNWRVQKLTLHPAK